MINGVDLAMFGPLPFGPMEFLVIAVFGVLIFGKRLPEVGRNVGKGIVEFKKGLKGIGEETDRESSTPSPTIRQPAPALPNENVSSNKASTEFKFDPETGQPIQPQSIPSGAKFDPYTGKPLNIDEATGGMPGAV